jgi:hypothetical protein
MENRPIIWTNTWWKFAVQPNRFFFIAGFVKSSEGTELVELFEVGKNEPVRPYRTLKDFTVLVENKTLLQHSIS